MTATKAGIILSYSYSLLFQMQGMTHAFLLGLQVAVVVFVGGDFDGDVLDDFQTVGFEADTLGGVVGHEAHFVDA